MKYIYLCLIGLIITITGSSCSVTKTEEAKFTVTKTDGNFEIRDYNAYILAIVTVEGTREEAGNKAFRPLFRFISGENKIKRKIAMTAPVSQEAVSEKIEMTAPVSQVKTGDKWSVSFMMPADYTMETVPQPTNEQVVIKEIPAQRIAAVRYSGGWSEKSYLEQQKKLEEWIKDNNLTPIGDPVWARYNPPFTPAFLRRNEVLIPIAP